MNETKSVNHRSDDNLSHNWKRNDGDPVMPRPQNRRAATYQTLRQLVTSLWHSTRCLPLLLVTVLLGPTASTATAEEAPSVREQVMHTLAPISDRIDAIEVFAVPVDAERRFSYASQKGRLHLFIRFTAADQSGWTELNLGSVRADTTIERYTKRIQWFRDLKGLTPAAAIEFLQKNQEKFRHSDLEAAEMAVLDLAGRLLNKSCMEMLTLTQTDPIPGLFCILSDDPATVSVEARRSLDQNLRTHLKVKLYGNTDTDGAVIRAARAVMGPKAYLTGDVNMGYRRQQADGSVDDIVAAMLLLQAAGLDACEDPATMSPDQWAEVQRRVGTLSLIPDVPLRPAWKSKLNLNPATGNIFNMHPASMGSLIETVELGRTIQKNGKKLMIGDASLVGPACPAWQQIAIGLGADWVEALEKPQENDVFQRCTTRNPVSRTPDGRYEVKERLPGFGVEMDLKKLKELSSDRLSL